MIQIIAIILLNICWSIQAFSQDEAIFQRTMNVILLIVEAIYVIFFWPEV